PCCHCSVTCVRYERSPWRGSGRPPCVRGRAGSRPHGARVQTARLADGAGVQSREQLLDEVWGLSPETRTRTVDTHVKRLREKLGQARDLLETVRASGYRLVEPSVK